MKTNLCGRRRSVVLGVSFRRSEWFILKMLYGPTFPSTSPFGRTVVVFFSSRCKTLSKYFLLFSKPFYTTSGCKLCVSFCKKNLTLPTCLLSFVCDSILSREKVHNILIFAKFLSYSVGDMVGGGAIFLGYKYTKTNINISHSTL